MALAFERRGLTTDRAAVAVIAAVFVLLVAVISAVVPDILKPAPDIFVVPLVAAVPLMLGILVVIGAPRHRAGVLLAAAGLVGLAENAVAEGRSGPFEGLWMLLYLPFALLLLVMPDGVAASGRWRTVGWTLTSVTAIFAALVALAWFAPGASAAVDLAALPLLAVFLVCLVLCASAPVVRYRRADDLQCLRLRWMLVAAATLPFTLLLCWSSYLLLGGPELVAVGLVLMYVAIPVGVAISVLRPGVFDIDRLAVGLAALTVLGVTILAVLTLASAVVGAPVSAWPGAAAIPALTVLCAGATYCAPLVHRLCDRLLYPERARGVATVRDLIRRIDRGDGAPEDLERVLRVALRDPGLLVAYRDSGSGELVLLGGGRAQLGERASAVLVRGEQLGALVSSSARVKPPPVVVARAAAPLIDAIRLRAELAEAKNAIEASRERILRAGYDERRRLERDLHDGAQQRLVALGMRLRVLQRTTSTDRAIAATLDTAVAELSTAVAELRRLAQGVRPSALDDGLGAALAALAQQMPTRVELDVNADDLPDAVATTAYFVVSEAVANALKHSRASRVRVSVARTGDDIRVRVEDDGVGGAISTATGGLTGLADRVGALGGHLEVSSPRGAGTTVDALLPCAS